jgi:ribose-phosphate pyrophosphokinase
MKMTGARFEVTMNGSLSIDYKRSIFPGGELFVRISNPNFYDPKDIVIQGNIETANDIMELLLLVDALDRTYPGTARELVCPYFPYARQDRVMVPGESLSVAIMASIINSCAFHKVTIWDAHSDVTPALLHRVTNIPQDDLLARFMQNEPYSSFLKECMLVAPDAGAAKKTFKIAQSYVMEMVQAEKIRDVKTGDIKATYIPADLKGTKRNYLIVDDICDGGRTFIELAKVIKKEAEPGCEIYLYVTHGIFSKGLNVFKGLIDGIFCPNVFSSVDTTRLDFLDYTKNNVFSTGESAL